MPRYYLPRRILETAHPANDAWFRPVCARRETVCQFLRMLRSHPLMPRLSTIFCVRALALSLSLILSLCGFVSSASAADIVNLRYLDTRSSVPLEAIETLAEGGETSEALQTFLNQTPLDVEDLATLLDASIPDTGIPLGPTDIQFLLFQLNKVVGDPSSSDFEPLGLALRSAYLDGDMSVLELLRRYPESEVRLDLRRLSIVQRDADLFVRRLSTLFTFFEEVLPDLVCECETDTVALGTYTTVDVESVPCNQADEKAIALAIAETSDPLKAQDNPFAEARSETIPRLGNEIRPMMDLVRPSAIDYAQADKAVVITLGPLQRSFPISELTLFAETGEAPSGWQSDVLMANINTADLRAVLTSEVEVDLLEMDGLLNSLPGEYALFQFGQLVHTPSRRANVQATRGAIILSASDDNKVSLLEVLQNYPTQQIIVEAERLLKLGSSLQSRGGVEVATRSLEDVLVEIQVAIAAEICDCDVSVSGSTI